MLIGICIGGFMFYLHNVVDQEFFEKVQLLESLAMFLFIGVILVINIASYLHLKPSPTN